MEAIHDIILWVKIGKYSLLVLPPPTLSSHTGGGLLCSCIGSVGFAIPSAKGRMYTKSPVWSALPRGWWEDSNKSGEVLNMLPDDLSQLKMPYIFGI